MAEAAPPIRPNAAGQTDDWPPRPWLLAGLLAGAGLVENWITSATQSAGMTALGVCVAAFALTLAFTVERTRTVWAAAFAVIAGLTLGGIAWQIDRGAAGNSHPDYAFVSGIAALLIAVPLFQAAHHAGSRHIAYPRVHFHVWNDIISGIAALAFTGLTWLLLWLMAALFNLIQLDFLEHLLGRGWFEWTISGAAFGAALGILRENETIIATLQRVVMLVLTVLAVPLAAGLAVFLAALVFSGPEVLWHATKAATPVLLACILGAFVLTNAVIRAGDAEESRNPVLRTAALVLTLTMLPLALFAAVSTGLRIHQYGLSPDRIWAVIVVAVACAYGLAYLVAAIRGRGRAWAPFARVANLRLAIGVSVMAALLALPLLDFGGIAARDQLARLASGKVRTDNFDFAGLRWDFGPAGRRALQRLERSGTPEQRVAAKSALAQTQRAYFRPDSRKAGEEVSHNLELVGGDAKLSAALLAYLTAQSDACRQRCVAIRTHGPVKARERIVLVDRGWSRMVLSYDPATAAIAEEPLVAPRAPTMTATARVEVRDVTRQQIFIDGKPLGEPLP